MDYGKHQRWTHEQALAAFRLRKRGLSYPAIGIVLELYEGAPPMTGEMVRVRLRYRGAAAKYVGRPNPDIGKRAAA
jgi:hypothetical protein